MLARDVAVFLERVAPLTFGIGATIGSPPQMQVMAAGSGVFIAPFLAITARHVSRALFDLEGGDPGFSEEVVPARHAPFLFQVLKPGELPSPGAMWHVDQSRDFVHTDLCLMQVSAENGTALTSQHTKGTKFVEIELLPPPVGETVQAFGYPRHSVRTDGHRLTIDAPATFSEGIVKAIYSPFRDRVMLNFPAFEVEMFADHGFSGGPVFHQGRLCGLVSAGLELKDSSLQIAYVASLWPLLTANVDFGLGKSRLITDLLQRGAMFADNWEAINSKIVMRSDEHGQYLDLE